MFMVVSRPFPAYNVAMTSRTVHILLVEGASAKQASLLLALKREWMVTVARTGSAAVKIAAESRIDLVVFNASTMRSTGIRSCQRLRKQLGDRVPLIHVYHTVLGEEINACADVCLIEPFTPRKLHNRIRALLPADETAEQIVRSGNLILYVGKRSVEIVGKGEFPLTPKLAKLIEAFLRHPNEILTRKQLMEQVWQTSYVGDTRTLDVHMSWLRGKLENEPSRPVYLQTVRGVGYRFAKPE